MLDDNTREQIALKRFSVISPVINGQVENQMQYFREVTASTMKMPYYGEKLYSPATIKRWLIDYRQHGFDALKPGFRSDKGTTRKITVAMEEAIRKQLKETPRMKASVLYEKLLEDKVFTLSELSRATFYRYLNKNPELLELAGEGAKQNERRRFSYANVNDLWQSDVMYGPYVHDGNKRRQTYLIAFLDDASRMPTYSAFYYEQNFLSLRDALKEAVLRRGKPKMVYTDNGKIFRSQQFALICASFGCSVLYAKPFEPQGKGKVERMFRTVRERFLNKQGSGHWKSLDQLNKEYWRWLEVDYLHKEHTSLGRSPVDFFLSQADSLRMVSNPQEAEEHFLLRVNRKVSHDATIRLENLYYETDPKFAKMQVQVRYDPEWLQNPHKRLPLYSKDVRIGEAVMVNFQDNSHRKRRRAGRPPEDEPIHEDYEKTMNSPSISVSFAKMNQGGTE